MGLRAFVFQTLRISAIRTFAARRHRSIDPGGLTTTLPMGILNFGV
jgi:hypothetical protein